MSKEPTNVERTIELDQFNIQILIAAVDTLANRDSQSSDYRWVIRLLVRKACICMLSSASETKGRPKHSSIALYYVAYNKGRPKHIIIIYYAAYDVQCG